MGERLIRLRRHQTAPVNRISLKRCRERMSERGAAIARDALDAELGCFIIRWRDNSKGNMKLARIEYAHPKCALYRSGRFHAFIHELNLSIIVE
jgi:hypothetical protein